MEIWLAAQLKWLQCWMTNGSIGQMMNENPGWQTWNWDAIRDTGY
jgi:hypothetical protein